MAHGDYAQALTRLHRESSDPWTPERLEAELAPFFAEHGALDVTPRARAAHLTRVTATAARRFDVTHVLRDPTDDNTWALHGEIDLTQDRDPKAPLVRLIRISE